MIQRDSYDEIAYPSLPRSQTHPARLGTLATLFGMTPVPLDRCRVLELGTGDGANLIPLAFDHPDGRFTGIDRAETPIEAGRAVAAQLGLKNVEFQKLDLLDWNPAPGEFDYIVAHGIYSWAPAEVREKILSGCAAALSPNGLAYISYNALPGCHLRRFVWDLLKFHTRDLPSPQDKMTAATALAKTMAEQTGGGPWQAAIREEFESVLEKAAEVTFHDDMSACNTPFCLLEFSADAERHGLHYLSDTDLQRDDVRALPFHGGTWLEQRQYGDYFVGRRFRETILCRKDVRIDRDIDLRRLAGLYIASRAEPALEPAGEGWKFKLPGGSTLATNDPDATELLRSLAAKWPESLPVSELPIVQSRPDQAADLFLNLFQMGAVELRTEPPRMASAVSEFPAASLLVRVQLSNGSARVTNQRHMTVELTDALSRAMLLLLDGSRDRAAVLHGLAEAVQSGTAIPGREAPVPQTLGEIEAILRDGLEISLRQMARMCLLVR